MMVFMDNGQKLYSCIVLSGGMSRRMGQDKGSMIIQEKPMILHILERLNYKINDAVIVLNDSERIANYQSLLNQYCDGDLSENFDYALKFAEDEIKGKGPVSGIMTGLKNIKTDYALVLPCDSPFISEGFIETMFDLLEGNLSSNVDAIIPFHIKSNKDKFKDNDEFNFDDAGEMPLEMKIQNSEPLHSIYKKENLNKIEGLLKEDSLYVKSFIRSLENPLFIEVDNKVLFDGDFRNFNRKEDLEELI
jgi:molybdopterin-guanine dinucleotide biosynthesis protein A